MKETKGHFMVLNALQTSSLSDRVRELYLITNVKYCFVLLAGAQCLQTVLRFSPLYELRLQPGLSVWFAINLHKASTLGWHGSLGTPTLLILYSTAATKKKNQMSQLPHFQPFMGISIKRNLELTVRQWL